MRLFISPLEKITYKVMATIPNFTILKYQDCKKKKNLWKINYRVNYAVKNGHTGVKCDGIIYNF
jgi:hypothetical protein